MTETPTAQAATRVLVVDDHPLIRKALAQLLASSPEFNYVGEAASGAEGYTLALALVPDLVLLDLDFGRAAGSGIDTLRALRDAGSDARIVILTVSDSPEDLTAAIRAGADGYLLKDADPEELLRGLRAAVSGATVISPSLAATLAGVIRGDAGAAARRLGDVTERERDILSLLTLGQSNKLIALELDITEGTVKVHVKSLLRKLGFRSRLEAAVWAIEQGLKAGPAGAKRLRRSG